MTAMLLVELEVEWDPILLDLFDVWFIYLFFDLNEKQCRMHIEDVLHKYMFCLNLPTQ